MELVRWNPWNEMMGIGKDLHRMFDGRSSIAPARQEVQGGAPGRWNPVVDVYETDEAYVVNAELPGMSKEDITIDVKDRILTVTGERSDENEMKRERYYRKERFFGRFERSFSLPEGVDSEMITAELKNGVLKVSIPRPEKNKPKRITVH